LAPRDLPSFPTRRSSDLGIHREARSTEESSARVCVAWIVYIAHQHRIDLDAEPLRDGGSLFGADISCIRVAIGQEDEHARFRFGDRKSTRLNSSHVKISY